MGFYDTSPHAYEYIKFLKQYPSEVRIAIRKIANREIPTRDELRVLYNFYESVNGLRALPIMTGEEVSAIQMLNEAYSDLRTTIEYLDNCARDAHEYLYRDDEDDTALFITLGEEEYWERIKSEEECMFFFGENADNSENIILESLQNSYDPFVANLIIETFKAVRPELWDYIVGIAKDAKIVVQTRAEELQRKADIIKRLEEEYQKIINIMKSLSPENYSLYYDLENAIEEFHRYYDDYQLEIDHICKKGSSKLPVCEYIQCVNEISGHLTDIGFFFNRKVLEIIDDIASNLGRDDTAAALAAYELYKHLFITDMGREDRGITCPEIQLYPRRMLEDLFYRKTGLRFDNLENFVIEKASEYCDYVNDIDYAYRILVRVRDGLNEIC